MFISHSQPTHAGGRKDTQGLSQRQSPETPGRVTPQQLDICTGHSDCSVHTMSAQPRTPPETTLHPEGCRKPRGFDKRRLWTEPSGPLFNCVPPQETRLDWGGAAIRRVVGRQRRSPVCEELVQQPCHRYREARVATFVGGW
jgi:hypothetical protein